MLPYFVADQAKVTVLRPLASSAFGKYSLILPEDVGVEDVHKLSAPGNELGFVASLSRRRVGGMARRFVRADVSIRAVDARSEDWIPSSDVHSVLSEAKERVSADFFLESDISLAGLGDWRPFVDFQLGDKARVDIFGMVVVMAVTRIEPKISDHSEDDWLVHVGAQLVSDDQARLAANEVLRRAVVENLKELAGVSAQASRAVSAAAEASSVAAGAQSTANEASSAAADAQSKADRAVVVAESQGKLAREAIQVAASSSAEAREATSRAMSADLASEEGKRIAIAANTTANQAQQTAIEANTRTNQIQQTAIEANERSIKAVGEVAAANAKANDAQQRAIEANSTALTLAPRFLHIDDGKPGFYGSSSGKLSTGAEFGSLEFRRTTFTKNSGAAFVSKAGWQGSILMICVATNGATDITATEITQAGQVHEMHAGGSFQAYRSATVVVLPVFSERKG